MSYCKQSTSWFQTLLITWLTCSILRSFLAHIPVRRFRVEASQARMSIEVSVHEYVLLSMPRNGLFTKVLLKPCHPQFAYKILILNSIWTATGSKLVCSLFFVALPIRSSYISTLMYGMSQQSLHEWVSTDQREKKDRKWEEKLLI